MNSEEMELFTRKLEGLFEKSTKPPMIYESTMHVEDGSGNFMWSKGHGGRTIDSIMNLASVTKLFTTTCILNLIQQGKLSFNDKINQFFNSSLLVGIHVYKGRDYSLNLTVEHLLFQNSGFPDVFAMGRTYSLNKRMIQEDMDLSLQDYVMIAKENKKKFAPGTFNKAHYSDLNFELLGKIIEQIENSSLHEAFIKYVFEPLKFKNTYLIEKESDYTPLVYYKHKTLHRPMLFRSIPASGGCASTSREVMIFLKAFFKGQLFDRNIVQQLRKFARIQYCPHLGQYGGGFVRLNIAGIASFYRCKGELIGHMGATGTYAYYYPEKDLYFVGDVNQLAKPGQTFILPMKLATMANRYISN